MILELTGIHLTSGNFSLEIDRILTGDVIAFFGPSGSGKTTLLDLIAGLRQPHSARIALDRQIFTDTQNKIHVPPRHRQIGFVPQDGALFPHLSVLGNLLGSPRSRADAPLFSIDHVVEVLQIGHLLRQNVRTLSGGEKQRVALGRALLSQPKLLLLDEPLSALDLHLKRQSIGLLQQVRREFQVPMIYVSHAAEEIVQLCDLVLVLEQGRAVRLGHPEEVFVRRNVSVLQVDNFDNDLTNPATQPAKRARACSS